MSLNEEVRVALNNAIEQALRKSPLRSAKVCKVLAVSADPTDGLMACDCKPVDGTAIIEDVKLTADEAGYGFILVPKVDSFVIVSFKSDSDAFVSMISSVEYVYLNGNTFGGLIKITELLSKINIIENQLNAIGVWGATVTPPLTLPPIVPTIKTEIENDKVQHGSGTMV